MALLKDRKGLIHLPPARCIGCCLATPRLAKSLVTIALGSPPSHFNVAKSGDFIHSFYRARRTVGRKSAFIDLGILFCKCQFLCRISLLLVITIYKNDTRIDSAQKRRNYNFFTKILYGASMKNRNISKTAGITVISL